MQKKIFSTSTTVIDNISLGDQYFKLKVKVSKKCFLQASPGQFAHVLCSQEIVSRKNRVFNDYYELKNYVRPNIDKLLESQLLLRRPFCIHDAYVEEINGKSVCVFEFLIRTKRKGTAMLSKLSAGDHLDILAPIGQPFDYKKSVKCDKNVIVVAGGMGVAPVVFLCRKLIENDKYPEIFFGFEEDFSLNAGHTMKTDLNRISKGLTITSNNLHEKWCKKGFVTDELEKHLKKMGADELLNTVIYSCGPHLMLKRLKQIAEQYGVDCEISMEERMACGIGACAVCVCKSSEGLGYKKVCVDGPVFNSKEITFE